MDDEETLDASEVIEKVLYLARGKCRENGCDGIYELSTEFQGCCLILHGKCTQGHQGIICCTGQ